MPELKPCPACGEAKSIVFIQEEFNNEWRGHCRCGHVGRYCATREAAITAWNSLPRALTWGEEPPKVEHVGKWFWSKLPGKSTVPVIVAELDGVLGIGRGTSEEGLTMETCREFGVKFAGPIPMPLEPEES